MSFIAEKVMARAGEKDPDSALTIRTLALSLRQEDIMGWPISKRQAIEYVKFFQIIYSEVT